MIKNIEFYHIWVAVILVLMAFMPLTIAEADESMTFILPKWGGAMVHSDCQNTDNINLSVPKDNVKIVWHNNNYDGEKAGTMGNGIAGNGEIAACTFNGIKDNLVIYNYNGEYLWHSDDRLNAVAATSTPMVDINNRVVACDNKKILMINPYDDGNGIVWESKIPEGRMLSFPFSPTIVDDKTIVLPVYNGPVYAFDVQNGDLLAMKELKPSEVAIGKRYFSPINSACVNGNRVYITTEYFVSSNNFGIIYLGRLYAIDVNPDADIEERLSVAWFYPFIGRSQASPLLINDCVYFDIYNPRLGRLAKPYVCAIIDQGEDYKEKWRIRYPELSSFSKVQRGKTWYSFSKDPRGGFWYEDFCGRRLVRFNEDDGNIIEEILVNNLVKEERLGIYWPLSCMTICETVNPIMVISVNSLLFSNYVLAIDLNANNSVLWKVKIKSVFGFNYNGGQFTILKQDNDPCKNRIVFGTYFDGVMAIGG